MAFVAVCGKPEAGVGPGGVDGRGGARADGHCVAGAVFDARRGRYCGGRRRRSRGRFAAVTVLLGWDRVGVGPETAAVLPRFGFCRGVGGRRVEALVMVCVAIAHHLQVDVFSADEDCAEDAAVLVLGLPHYGNVFAEDVVRELLFRLLPEGLRLLGRVDCVEADLVLGVPVADDCDRVAVGNRDDAALEGFDSRRERGRVNRLRVGQLLPRGGCTAQTLRRGGCAAGVRLRVGGRYAALLRRSTPPLKS